MSFNETRYSNNLLLSCEELGGIGCAAGENCIYGSIKYASDVGALCCVGGTCKKDEERSGGIASFIFGLVLIVIICSCAYFIYKQSKKIKSENPEKKFREAEKAYVEKFR